MMSSQGTSSSSAGIDEHQTSPAAISGSYSTYMSSTGAKNLVAVVIFALGWTWCEGSGLRKAYLIVLDHTKAQRPATVFRVANKSGLRRLRSTHELQGKRKNWNGMVLITAAKLQQIH